jgi:hypothetical protein
MRQTANDEASVAYLTLSSEGDLGDRRRAAIEDAVRGQGGSVVWRTSAAAGRSYGLLAVPDAYDAAPIRAMSAGTLYDKPIIALAVFPALAEALPSLGETFAGAGRPAGVLACMPCPGGIIVEWDPSVTGAEVVVALVDVELRRWQSGRTAELLSPLPRSLVAKLAANGLRAPEIAPERVLESGERD